MGLFYDNKHILSKSHIHLMSSSLSRIFAVAVPYIDLRARDTLNDFEHQIIAFRKTRGSSTTTEPPKTCSTCELCPTTCSTCELLQHFVPHSLHSLHYLFYTTRRCAERSQSQECSANRSVDSDRKLRRSRLHPPAINKCRWSLPPLHHPAPMTLPRSALETAGPAR